MEHYKKTLSEHSHGEKTSVSICDWFKDKDGLRTKKCQFSVLPNRDMSELTMHMEMGRIAEESNFDIHDVKVVKSVLDDKKEKIKMVFKPVNGGKKD